MTNQHKTYTKEELHFFMENPSKMIDVAEENDLTLMWQHFLHESPEMTLSEIVEEFFYHNDLLEE